MHPVEAFNRKGQELGVVTYLPQETESSDFREEVLDAVEHGGACLRMAGDVLLVSRAPLSDRDAAAWRISYDAMLAVPDPRFSLVGPRP